MSKTAVYAQMFEIVTQDDVAFVTFSQRVPCLVASKGKKQNFSARSEEIVATVVLPVSTLLELRDVLNSNIKSTKEDAGDGKI